MMQKAFRALFSMSFAGILLVIYAFALATATIIETKFGTDTAKLLIYNSHWLEVIYFFLFANLTGNVFRFRLYRRGKLTIGMFHIAFIIMLIGSTVTRYWGEEGMMHIRQGETVSSMVSSESFFKASLPEVSESIEKNMLLSPIFAPSFSHTFPNDLNVEVAGFIENAQQILVDDVEGEPVIEVVASTMFGNEQLFLFKGKTELFGETSLSFEGKDSDVVIERTKDGLIFRSLIPVTELKMGQAAQSENSTYSGKFEQGKMYQIGTLRLVLRRFQAKASLQATSSAQSTGRNAIFVDLSQDGKAKRVILWNQKGVISAPESYSFNNNRIELSYGQKNIDLPFSLRLNEFIMTRYEGSNSPASFESVVQLLDTKKTINREEHIFMNNVLDYRGYRFFQSSYDQDEQGTVLSVNNDRLGTLITYIGYFLLSLGMFLSLFWNKTYFVKTLKSSSQRITVLFFLLCLGSVSNAFAADKVPTSAVADDFGHVMVQGVDGRIEPFSTYSNELILKMTSRSVWEGASSDQVILGMISQPDLWKSIPMLKVSEEELALELGISGKYASFNDFFTTQGSYKLNGKVSEVYRKNPAQRNNYEKELMKVDERINVAYMVYNYSVFRFFPDPQKKTEQWIAPSEFQHQVNGGDSLFIQNVVSMYASSVQNNEGKKQKEYLESIKRYQKKYAIVSLPSESKTNIEFLYNRISAFKRLFPVYLILGFILMFIYFIRILDGKDVSSKVEKSFLVLLVLAFIMHTAALIIRGVLAGHMPWSNGYESMLYVAWSAMFAGLIFANRNVLVLCSASILAGITLFVAHLSWMNPEITNLVPVLRSYWLTLHVAIITASYGFIGVSAFLGLFNLILMIIRNSKNGMRIDAIIKQLTGINEVSIIIGLYMLTIGTFLGGVWANEAWGRYWGWDPKETWSLITILVYTFITHMRMIPGLKDRFSYNFATVVGFASVIMTYLGVNYYLSGLHSYGAGKAGSVTVGVSIAFAFVALLSLWAREKESKLE